MANTKQKSSKKESYDSLLEELITITKELDSNNTKFEDLELLYKRGVEIYSLLSSKLQDARELIVLEGSRDEA